MMLKRRRRTVMMTKMTMVNYKMKIKPKEGVS